MCIATGLHAAVDIALERMYNQRALRYMLPWLPRDIDEIHEFFGGDPWPYGVEENRPTLAEASITEGAASQAPFTLRR